MKLSNKTLNTFKNYSQINHGIIIHEGKLLRTCDAQSTFISMFEVDEDFPKRVAIFDLPELLSCISIFDDPDYNWGDDFVTISQGKRQLRYLYSAESTISSLEDDEMPDFDDSPTQFILTNKMIDSIIKIANILNLDVLDMSYDGNSESFILDVIDVDGGSKNNYNIDVDLTEGLQLDAFQQHLKVSYLNVIPDDYECRIIDGSIEMTGINSNIVYIASLVVL